MDVVNRALEEIKKALSGIEIKLDEPFKAHTTFKIGGNSRAMLFPQSADEITEICNILDKHGITPLVIGNGSNILANDDTHDIVVINTTKLDGISLCDESGDYKTIKADAGVLLSKLAVFAYENGLTGLEFAHGIPGTVGGAVVMNAGAYGSELKDVIFNVTAYSKNDGIQTLTAADSGFSYRNSRFSNTDDDVVVSSTFKLKPSEKEDIKKKMDELCFRRRESQPLEFASGGSTFKRPKEGYAAALIEQAGLKGYTVGGAQVSEKHSGFVINKGNAAFDDVMAVIKHVQETVHKHSSVMLEPEIKIIRG